MNVAAYHAILRRLGVEPARTRTTTAADRDAVLAQPLDVFAREGRPLEVRVDVECWPETLWFVPDIRHAEALCREGVGRERIWTADELLALLGGNAWPTEALRMVMVVRKEFGGEVVEVRPL